MGLMDSVNLKGFKKVNEAVAPELLGEDELTILRNAVLDKELGHPKKRGHWSRYGAATALDANDILALDNVETSDDTDYILASNGAKVQGYKVSNNTVIDVITGLTAGQKFRMTPYADKFIFVFDTNDDPKVVSGAALGTSLDLEITKTVVTAITGSNITAASGNLEPHTLYKYVFVGITETGELSPPSQPFTHFITGAGRQSSTDATKLTLRFDSIPASTDTRVVKKLLFRTKSDEVTHLVARRSGDIFYYHSTLPDTDTFFVDDTPDADLGEVAIYYNMPTRAKYLAINNNRLFLGDFSKVTRQFISPPHSKVNPSPDGSYSAGDAIAATDVPDGGTLLDSTLYEYYVHFTNRMGTLSQFYIQTSVTTGTGGAADKHAVTISGITSLTPTFRKQYPLTVVYRQTAGTGGYKKIGEKTQLTNRTDFTDTGIADGIAWVDPDAVANVKAYPSGIAFSEIGQVTSFRDEDTRQVFDQDGDPITGMSDDGDGVVVAKKRGINKVFTSGSPTNWRVYNLEAEIGCSEPNTFVKLGTDYFFIYNKMAYKWSSGGVKSQIGFPFVTSLGEVTTWNSATITKEWYLIAGQVSTAYYVYVYDRIVDTWYRFSTDECKALAVKKYGTDAGTILGNNDNYITKYNTPTANARVDLETGASVNITVKLKTKTFTFPDGITLARMRNYLLAYNKVANVGEIANDTTTTITDEVTASTYVKTDNSGSGLKTYEASMANVPVTYKVSFDIEGSGFEEWGSLRAEYRTIRRGKAVSQ